jgi:hypothetical protein
MTDEQINQRIAEACGWTKIEHFPGGFWGQHPLCLDEASEYYDWPIPNYCNDLNAMHEAEKTLNSEQWHLYSAWLFKATARPQHATARQRAEAFLRTLGKWEGD